MDKPHIHTRAEAEALREMATSGPWHVLEYAQNDATVVVAETSGDKHEHPGAIIATGMSARDACLIAAAPDLAASVAHHAQRADDAEAEVKRLQSLEVVTMPRHLGVALRAATRAFEDCDDAALRTVAEELQPLVDAAMSRIGTAEAEIVRLRDLVRRAFVDGYNWTGDGPREDVGRAWSRSIAFAEVTKLASPELAEVSNVGK